MSWSGGGIDCEGDGVSGIVFVLVFISSRIGEFIVGNVDYTIGGAVCVWSECGGVIGAGASEIRECAACDVDIAHNEIGGSL